MEIMTPLARRSPRVPRRADREPLWAQILADLRRRVAEGEFTDAFPAELTLVDEYGVSRHTVREALRRLRSEGTVVAGRGQTPRLAGPVEIVQPVGALYSLFAAVESTGQIQRSVVRTLDTRADGVVAAQLGLEESSPLVYLERLRLADEQPLAVDRVWLPAELAEPLLEVDFTHTALYDEYASRCGVRLTGGHEHIRAVIPTAGERRLLGLGSPTAAFAIDRLGCSGEQLVEWRRTVVRGDRFVVAAQFSGRQGYQLDLQAQA